MNRIQFNTKSDGINILEEYFRKFKKNELGYYLENNKNMSIPYFLIENVYDPEDIELKNLFIKHLNIIIKNKNNEINNISKLIKISFISDLIYWNNLFVIKNYIFIKYNYLIKIFENIEYNKYSNMDNILIIDNEIFDKELLNDISVSIDYILLNTNIDLWKKFINNKYNCVMIPFDDIKLKYNYKILKEPNIDYLNYKLPVYTIGENIYTTFNSIISSDISFCPYWEKKIIQLEFENNIYIEKVHIKKN